MTQQQLITTYGLRFEDRLWNNRLFKIPHASSQYQLLANLLMEIEDPDVITDMTLPIIQAAINNDPPPPDNDHNLNCVTTWCYYHNNVFNFSDASNDTVKSPSFTMSPQDLYDVFVLWRQFLWNLWQ